MTVDEVAQALFDLATSTDVVVCREFIAGGPMWAADESQIVVHLESVSTVNQSGGGQAPNVCAPVRQAVFKVSYVNDCYPVPDDDGEPPSVASVTAWTVDYLASVDKIHGAVFTGVDSLVDDCAAIVVGLGLTRGPTGGECSFSFPVSVLLDLA